MKEKAAPAAAKAPAIKRKKGVSAKSLAVFTRQFSVMIDAGLPLVQCLEILGTQEEDKNFGLVILETRADVEGGASLADAMKKNPKVFDALFTNMIAAGEAGGILDTILKRLAIYIEKAVKLKNQVQVGDDLSRSAIVVHRHRRRRRHPLEGHSDVRHACSRASAPSCRCRPASSSRSATAWCASCRSSIVGIVALVFGVRTYYNTPSGRMVMDRHAAQAAGDGQPDAQDRGGAVLPHAGDAARVRRVDSRGARHHGRDRR